MNIHLTIRRERMHSRCQPFQCCDARCSTTRSFLSNTSRRPSCAATRPSTSHKKRCNTLIALRQRPVPICERAAQPTGHAAEALDLQRASTFAMSGATNESGASAPAHGLRGAPSQSTASRAAVGAVSAAAAALAAATETKSLVVMTRGKTKKRWSAPQILLEEVVGGFSIHCLHMERSRKR